MRKRKTHEEYINEIAIKAPNVQVDGQYISSKTKILHTCKICLHKWSSTPNDVLHGYGCPVCAHRVIGNAPEYKNSIWASEYKNYFSKYLTEKQMKQYMPNSTDLIEVPCPDCGNIKRTKPVILLRQGLGCICGDNTSYPNKFVFNVLKQLNIDASTEYTPKWANGKRYDVYLPYYNIIIENHGLQHYEEQHSTIFKSLQEEQENDILKKNLAFKNNISKYIVLDCRKSSLEWIKKSIIESDLLNILKVNELSINWEHANEFAMSNLVHEAAILFENNYSVSDISKTFGKHVKTIRRWIHTAYNLGWCTKEPRRESKPVYCIELNCLFPSIINAEKNTNTTRKAIKGNCKGEFLYAGTHPKTGEKLHWLYLNDAIDLGYILE